MASSSSSMNPSSPGLKAYFKTPEGRYKLQYEKTHSAGIMHYSHGKSVSQLTIAYLKEKQASQGPSVPSTPGSSGVVKSAAARLFVGVNGSKAFSFGGSNGGSKTVSGPSRFGGTFGGSAGSGSSPSSANYDGKGTYLIFNAGDSLFISDLNSHNKDPIKYIHFSISYPLCHAFDSEAKDGHDLLIGLQSGDIFTVSLRQQLQDPGKKLVGAQHYNKDGAINNSRCTCVVWVPDGDGIFVSAHADGNLYVYGKNKDGAIDPSFPAIKDPTQFSVTHGRSSKCNPIIRWHISQGFINNISFSMDGGYLATVGRDGYLRVFDYLKEQLTFGGKSYYGALLCCAWSPDGKYILTGGEDDLVQVWSMEERKIVAWGEGHNSWVSGVSFDSYWSAPNPDGKGENAVYRFGSVGQVFVRDFVPSAMAFLMNKEPDIVKNFLLKTLRLQSWEKRIDRFKLGEGAMPASFKVLHDSNRKTDTVVADFGESAIGRVAPVDSGFWWIILLRAYTKSTGDVSLAESTDCQKGMRLILSLCLSEGFDTFPTLLCADGCSMIDRRMGIYGYPIDIQALFFMALRCAFALLKQDAEGKEFIERIVTRVHALSYHIRTYFWLDFQQLNSIYRYKTEEYSNTAVNKFNVIPDSIPDWLFDFMPVRGGYFIGNVSPARMDFRWFALGNFFTVLSSLATPEQSTAVMDLIEERWEELVGEMPLKVAYPAIEAREWQIVTGCDPKNTRWSYHNGGSWPVLLWMLTAACIKTGRPQIARKAIELAERRLAKDGWPEYYDGKLGRYVGKQAKKFQTWSIAGYLVAKLMMEDPSHAGMICLEEDKAMKPALKRSSSWSC
ncbi:hypothetical protein KFK09_001117 [Dendrobium nobile]|uniref:beta-fructofuranosidase n=1 Tax=Dendrobium nobile TaxID=94219 RepID=A0A8T3C9Y6_DENNO|nr:hypothetical protein KFK09_001117 [Dendrobium nobile]